MKRMLMAVAAMMSWCVLADTWTDPDTGITWEYRVTRSGLMVGTIDADWATKYYPAIPTSTAGDITVPSTIGGYPVKIIATGAFALCSELTSVTVPASVSWIYTYAFAECSSLTNIIFTGDAPSTFFVRSAFEGITGHCVVVVNEGTKGWDDDGDGLWKQMTLVYRKTGGGLNKDTVDDIEWTYTVCNGESSVGSGSYLGAIAIASSTEGAITIPTRLGGYPVTSIGDYAFYGCNALTNVMISASVTSIGDSAFNKCSGLMNMTIPTNVTSVGNAAFQSCSALTSVTIPPSVTNIGSGAFSYCTSLTSVTIPSSVTSIGNQAYSDCYSLTSVTMPLGVTSIGEHAFGDCHELTSVTIPSTVTNICEGAFWVCRGLTSITIPPSVTSIGNQAFCVCLSLTSVMIPSSVTNIGSMAFGFCNALAVVYVDKGDGERVKGLYSWPSGVEFIEFVSPVVAGDLGASVEGDAEAGYVITPSESKTTVEVSIPKNVEASKVTVKVSPEVTRVTPHGATIRVVKGENDITSFLAMPAADAKGAIDMTAAVVKEEIVKEALDPEKGAVIELNAEEPTLTTPTTRKGLTYTLREGATLGEMTVGDSKVGDGKPWTPTITVKGGDSGFYTISVEK